jgi:hypothetical protein
MVSLICRLLDWLLNRPSTPGWPEGFCTGVSAMNGSPLVGMSVALINNPV